MGKSRDYSSNLDRQQEEAAKVTGAPKPKRGGIGAMAPKPEAEEKPKKTQAIAVRVPMDFYERLRAVEESLGIDKTNRGRFYTLLLSHGLDALERGELVIPRRERPDL